MICITLSRFSQPPKVNTVLTNDTEYGNEATGEVPSPAFVEKATPIDAMNKPIRNSAYFFMIVGLILLSILYPIADFAL